MWENTLTHERLLTGRRLYPLQQTPWQFFAPSGVDRTRCCVLSREHHTAAIAMVTAKVAVLFQRLGSADEESLVRVALENDAAGLLCHLKATEGGGVDNYC